MAFAYFKEPILKSSFTIQKNMFNLSITMKKYLSGLIVIIIAIGAFSFTSLKHDATKTSYYWFKLNSTTGNPKKSVGLPPFQSSGPLCCSSGPYCCAGAYVNYTDNGDGTFSASGMRQITEIQP